MCVSSGAAGVGGRFWGYRHRSLALGIAPAVSSSPDLVCGVCDPLPYPLLFLFPTLFTWPVLPPLFPPLGVGSPSLPPCLLSDLRPTCASSR